MPSRDRRPLLAARFPIAAILALAAGLAVGSTERVAGAQGAGAPRGPANQAAPGFPGIPGASGGVAMPSPAGPGPDADASMVSVTVVPARTKVMPGDRIPAAVVFELKSPWHIWTSESQAASLPSSIARFEGAQYTKVVVDRTSETLTIAVGAIQWPSFHAITADIGDGPSKYAVYEGRAVAYLPLIVAANATAGAANAELSISFQACNESTCMMPETVTRKIRLEVMTPEEAAAAGGAGAGRGAGLGEADAALFGGFDPGVFARIDSGALPVSGATGGGGGGSAPSTDSLRFQLFELEFTIDTRGWGRVLILLIAVAGGLLLNLTPCVLPVIPLKVMGLTQMAGDRSRSILLGCAMGAGVTAFWLALGVLMASIRGVDAISILFQNAWVTLAIGALIALMAVSMSGFFSFSLPSFVYAFEPKHESVGGSFLVGVMTAVLSTPCTGPFMGASLGWARAVDSPAMLLLIFLSIGLGMASPYIVLSAFPALVKRVPKAGPASEVVKQVMGLLLLAAAFYFIGTGVAGLLHWRGYEYWWVVVAPAIVAGAWLMWRTMRISRRTSNRLVFGSIGALIVAISAGLGHVMAGQVDPLKWPIYSAQAEQQALASGKVVVIKFTAHWCLSCKALEKTVLASTRVADRLSRPDVQVLSVDITGGEEDQTSRLKAAGSVTIPLLVVMAPDGREVWRSDAYKAQQVIDAVDKAASMGARAGAAAGSTRAANELTAQADGAAGR